MKKALYPGSFDPVTNGHLDVIQRASRLFDKIIVAVALNREKSPLFTIEERLDILKAVCRDIDNVEIVSFKGLLIDAVNEFDTCAVVRGLRAVSDFEYEFQMALMNRQLNLKCETVFLMPSPEYTFVSSRMVKEIAMCGGDVSTFVPEIVMSSFKAKRKGN